jgi:uncharacterized protein (TIGR02145 family)
MKNSITAGLVMLLLALALAAGCDNGGDSQTPEPGDGDSDTDSDSDSDTEVDMLDTSHQFRDARDGQVYEFVTIATQVWMSENLNYETSGSWCYDDAQENCEGGHGRLYLWETTLAGALPSETDPSGVTGICPAGWHLPSDAEWDRLVSFIGTTIATDATAGTTLKASSGWNDNGNGTDEVGFAALPTGDRTPDGDYLNRGDYVCYWTATEQGSSFAYYRYLRSDSDLVRRYYAPKDEEATPIRCVKDP